MLFICLCGSDGVCHPQLLLQLQEASLSKEEKVGKMGQDAKQRTSILHCHSMVGGFQRLTEGDKYVNNMMVRLHGVVVTSGDTT